MGATSLRHVNCGTPLCCAGWIPFFSFIPYEYALACLVNGKFSQTECEIMQDSVRWIEKCAKHADLGSNQQQVDWPSSLNKIW